MTTQPSLFAKSPEAWKPHAYQKKAIKFLLEHACAALLLDPGLGKSSITLAAIKILLQKKVAKKVLVIAPLRVCYNVWPGEIEKWQDFSNLRIEVLHGPKKDEALKRDSDIYAINPEGLDWLLQTTKTKGSTGKTKVVVDITKFKKLGFDTLVIDELTKFKNTNSNRFKALKQVHKTFGRRFGLTGSPASNGLMDLFGQCYILDEGQALGPYITHYRSKYFETVDKDGFVWVPQIGAPEKIYERLNNLVLRMAAEDYLELPQMVINNIVLELPPEVRKIYEALEEDLFAQIDKNTVVAANAAVATGKLRQVCGGALFLDREVTELGFKVLTSKREWAILHDEKLNALEDLVEELQGSPLLVAYEFNHELARLREKFPSAVFACDYKMGEFKALEAKWNSGLIPLLFGHPQSVGHGLNFQDAGNHVAWYSQTWDYELYDQFIRRVLRQGNKNKKVFVHHFLMHDTIDMTMQWSLKAKAKGQGALFNALKELASKRKHK
jgi:SNF2 family DNA or RNA helicase